MMRGFLAEDIVERGEGLALPLPRRAAYLLSAAAALRSAFRVGVQEDTPEREARARDELARAIAELPSDLRAQIVGEVWVADSGGGR